MRLKKHIWLIIYAAIFCLIGLSTVIYHFCLKPNHSVICYFINAFQLCTLGLGAFYLFRGYKKDDRAVLKTFIASCLVCVITELVYCVEIAKTYELFAKGVIIIGATNASILAVLLFGKDSPRKRTMNFCIYAVASTLLLAIVFAIIARESIFVNSDVSAITTLLDLVNCISFSCILLIAEYLKFKDKEETKSK